MSDMPQRMPTLVGIGSPIVDTVVSISDDFLRRYVGGEKGGMRLLNAEAAEKLLQLLPAEAKLSIGGSAMNTARAIARLGCPTAGIGKIGNDSNAEFYRQKIIAAGMTDNYKVTDALPTAQCLALVTPDAARTMRTYLGAAAEFSPNDLSPEDFVGVEYVYIEGYLLPNIKLAERIFDLARDADCTICINMGSFEVVRAIREKLMKWTEENASMMFGNVEEAREFFRDPTGTAKKLAQSMMSVCGFAAVTDGASGAVVAESGYETQEIPAPTPRQLIDTTGAGDFWAAGFLYGKITNRSISECGKIAARLAQEIIAVSGVELSAEKWTELRREFSATTDTTEISEIIDSSR